MKVSADAIGWIGAALLLTAYAMVSFHRLRPDSLRYQLANAVGSCCLIVNTVYYRAYPSAFVNVVWILIAVLATVRAQRTRSSAASS
jgi:hypothetical protein